MPPSRLKKGWLPLLAAGATGAGFLEGVHDASGMFFTLGRVFRAEAVYNEAEALCVAPELQFVKLRLKYVRRSAHPQFRICHG
jgi:hypothetical protein